LTQPAGPQYLAGDIVFCCEGKIMLRTLALSVVCGLVPAFAQATPLDAEVQKPLKVLINGIRYGKTDLAAKQISFAGMAQRVLAPEWASVSPEQRDELAKGFETIIRKDTFVKAKDQFKYLDAILFASARLEGTDAHCPTTIVVHHELKKMETVIDFVLEKVGGAWKVVDMVIMKESTIAGIREDDVAPLLKKGGVPAVIQAVRDRTAAIK
jgi:phospholipid transport system substrate-binding protein